MGWLAHGAAHLRFIDGTPDNGVQGNNFKAFTYHRQDCDWNRPPTPTAEHNENEFLFTPLPIEGSVSLLLLPAIDQGVAGRSRNGLLPECRRTKALSAITAITGLPFCSRGG